MLINNFKVDSPSVEYQEGHILSSYSYASTDIKQDEKSGAFLVSPKETRWTLRTDTTVPKLVSVVFLLARPHTADNLMAGTWQCNSCLSCSRCDPSMPRPTTTLPENPSLRAATFRSCFACELKEKAAAMTVLAGRHAGGLGWQQRFHSHSWDPGKQAVSAAACTAFAVLVVR